ncbi:hypothetical protein OQJ65_06440 [Vibrio sp. Sgm 22]|nr:hypothetical protein [Vibrio sp. 14G-20]MCX2774945.1 hypothetical protein [Vibrio sp. Sgm 22]
MSQWVLRCEEDMAGLATLFHEDAIFILNSQGDFAKGPKALIRSNW